MCPEDHAADRLRHTMSFLTLVCGEKEIKYCTASACRVSGHFIPLDISSFGYETFMIVGNPKTRMFDDVTQNGLQMFLISANYQVYGNEISTKD